MTIAPRWVVKLGGSLQAGARLQDWLRLLASFSGAGVVIVPGGGVFADAVRQLQPQMGYDDEAAHHMAILAMAQTATALASLEPALQLADSRTALMKQVGRGRTAIWRPLDIVLAPPDLEPGWDITADSLALWLAGQLQVPRLMLVKACEPGPFTSWSEWASRGVVDERFPRLARSSRVTIDVLHATDLERARQLLAQPRPL